MDEVPQASDAVGLEKLGLFGQLTEPAAPTPLMTGAVLSVNVIVCDAVVVLPQASLAVHVRFIE